jgi:hypothetical protein
MTSYVIVYQTAGPECRTRVVGPFPTETAAFEALAAGEDATDYHVVPLRCPRCDYADDGSDGCYLVQRCEPCELALIPPPVACYVSGCGRPAYRTDRVDGRRQPICRQHG